MSYQLPNLKDLMQKARLGFRKHLKGSDAWLWPNNVYVVAKVIAGHAMEIIGFARYISQQMFAHTATDIESVRLHGEEFAIPQNPAAPASGLVDVTVTAAIQILSGAIFRRTDDVEFISVGGGSTNGAGTVTVQVIAAQAGLAGNTVAGASLQLVSGFSGGGDVSSVVNSAGIILGVDLEDIESWRARILFRKRNPPHGGSAADYVLWAGQVPGVSFYGDRPTVFVEPRWGGPGTVRVFPLMYDLYPTGIPSGPDVSRVADYIATVQPAGADVVVVAPTAVVVNVTIDDLYPDTTGVRETVALELQSAFRRLSRVAGTHREIPNMPFLASPFAFSRSWIWQAVSNASGEQRHKIISPAADIALTPGQMAVLGTVTFL